MRRVNDLIDRGCFACGEGLAGTASAFVAIAELRLTGSQAEPSRHAVLVCADCATTAEANRAAATE